jgi:N-hydroxyarylamine O-acetyltransferase
MIGRGSRRRQHQAADQPEQGSPHAASDAFRAQSFRGGQGSNVTDEWEIEQLDLGAYLRRVGHDGDTAPSALTLAALHRAHLAAIPFENLDVVLGRGIAVDLDSVQAKLVERRRGGYCYEHGVLFGAVLERLGFTVERMLARVGGEELERPRAPTHMTLRVATGAERWLADVGFGSGVLQPLRFDAEGPQVQGEWTFAVASTGPRSWALRERRGGEWVTRYGVDEQRLHAADVVMANHFTSTFERSPFVGRLVVMRRDERSIRSLIDRRLALERPDGSVEERDVGDAELGGLLREQFAIPLDDDEVTQLTFASRTPG